MAHPVRPVWSAPCLPHSVSSGTVSPHFHDNGSWHSACHSVRTWSVIAGGIYEWQPCPDFKVFGVLQCTVFDRRFGDLDGLLCVWKIGRNNDLEELKWFFLMEEQNFYERPFPVTIRANRIP